MKWRISTFSAVFPSLAIAAKEFRAWKYSSLVRGGGRSASTDVAPIDRRSLTKASMFGKRRVTRSTSTTGKANPAADKSCASEEGSMRGWALATTLPDRRPASIRLPRSDARLFPPAIAPINGASLRNERCNSRSASGRSLTLSNVPTATHKSYWFSPKSCRSSSAWRPPPLSEKRAPGSKTSTAAANDCSRTGQSVAGQPRSSACLNGRGISLSRSRHSSKARSYRYSSTPMLAARSLRMARRRRSNRSLVTPALVRRRGPSNKGQWGQDLHRLHVPWVAQCWITHCLRDAPAAET